MTDHQEPDFEELLRANKRGAQDFWYWRDKPVMELGAAKEIFAQAGFSFKGLRARNPGDDPPDCEGYLEGQRCGVEVSELVHEPTLRATIKGKPQYFLWERNDLVEKIQERISRKDRVDHVKGGPYDRYFLVLMTDEFMLGREQVNRFLEGYSFTSHMITDVVLGLSYDPSVKVCPAFRLTLSKP
jgi:hypothetical protein